MSPRRLTLLLSVVLLLVAGGVASWWLEARSRPRGIHYDTPPNIVFLLLDTVRADHISCYGYSRPTTPRIDQLAQRGTRFTNAQSMAPWTIPSVASLWTGMPPSVHSAGIPNRIRAFRTADSFRGFKESELPTLPQLLARRGYVNFAYFANPLLTNPCYVAGFDPGRCLVQRDTAETVIAKAIHWLPELSQSQRPFFLYLQLMDAHQPIDPPPAYRDLFPTDGTDRGEHRFADWGGYGQPARRAESTFEAFRASKVAVYDGALRYMDDQIGQLLDALEAQHLSDSTIVVVTADHGEEMWDHAEMQAELYNMKVRDHVGIGHGHTQFQELLHVPLIIAGPQLPQRVIDERVSMPDIGATLLELASGDREASLGMASSLVDLMLGDAQAGHAVMSEEISFGFEIKALVDAAGMKLIAATETGEKDALFDLQRDPGETENLLAQRPDVVAKMKGMLRERLESSKRRRREAGTTSRIDDSQLRKLGYTAPGAPAPGGDHDQPKDHEPERKGGTPGGKPPEREDAH